MGWYCEAGHRLGSCNSSKVPWVLGANRSAVRAWRAALNSPWRMSLPRTRCGRSMSFGRSCFQNWGTLERRDLHLPSPPCDPPGPPGLRRAQPSSPHQIPHNWIEHLWLKTGQYKNRLPTTKLFWGTLNHAWKRCAEKKTWSSHIVGLGSGYQILYGSSNNGKKILITGMRFAFPSVVVFILRPSGWRRHSHPGE